MRLAKHGGEGDVENLIAGSIDDVQHPTAPIFHTRRHQERVHHQGGVVTRLGEVDHGGAAAIDQYAFGTGAMEIDLSHLSSPKQSEVQAIKIAATVSAENSDRFLTGEVRAGRIDADFATRLIA